MQAAVSAKEADIGRDLVQPMQGLQPLPDHG